jgi:type I restriction enzyme, R subunit
MSPASMTAYATNGEGIIEADLTSGVEHDITRFPTPDELWAQLSIKQPVADRLHFGAER